MESLHEPVGALFDMSLSDATNFLQCYRKPIGVLEGHTAPIFFVRADPLHSRIYSIGNDNTVMVRTSFVS